MKNCLTQPNIVHPVSAAARTGKICQSFVLILLVTLLAACGQATPPLPGAVLRQETMALPTGAPSREPTPVSTRVIPFEDLTPGPAPTITPLPDEVRALVVDVLDGDTISVVMEGDPPSRAYTVRYLGIDAPPNTASVPWGAVAYETNRDLTKGKVVRLERDQSDTDEEGNLLRYVYLGDSLLNVILAERGLARASVAEPDTRFQTEISEAEAAARGNNLGLWGNPPTRTPASAITPTTAVTTTVTTAATVAPSETTEPEATTEDSGSSTSPTTEAEATGTSEPN